MSIGVPLTSLVHIQIGDDEVSFPVEGETFWGQDRVLIHDDDNLLATTAWNDDGYTVQPFLEAADFGDLREGIDQLIRRKLSLVGVGMPDSVPMTAYHRVLAEYPGAHESLMDLFRDGFPVEEFPVDPTLLESRVSELCGFPLSLRVPSLGYSVFCVRIARPGCRDWNPPHRDAWLDTLRNGLNLYVPIAGSTDRSALGLIPGSHFWRESDIERTREGARIYGRAFGVPSVINAARPLKMRRPNPGLNEAMLFSPYLVHGMGANFNEDETRVSLELRVWRKIDSKDMTV